MDFVIEKDGTRNEKGRPLAFIEVAWRRYTKHSRNKAQEIQGAILPIAEKHSWDSPFLGAIIAGVFTENSISQMESVGFKVLYIPYETIVDAFASEGIDVSFDEGTEDNVFKKCVRSIQKSPKTKLNRIKNVLVDSNKKSIDSFKSSLKIALSKMVDSITVIPLYGMNAEFHNIDIAIAFITGYSSDVSACEFRKFEIIVRYTNGDTIDASFADKEKAVSFLAYLRR